MSHSNSVRSVGFSVGRHIKAFGEGGGRGEVCGEEGGALVWGLG